MAHLHSESNEIVEIERVGVRERPIPGPKPPTEHVVIGKWPKGHEIEQPLAAYRAMQIVRENWLFSRSG